MTATTEAAAETETEAADPRSLATTSPLDGSELAPIEATAPSAVAKVVRRARDAQAEWAALPVHERARIVGQLKGRILSRAEEIADTVRAETGKPLEEAALAEVLPNADLVDHWTEVIEELLAPQTVELDAVSYPGKAGRIYKLPRGVLGLITPWNYPVAIPLRAIVPAVLAGNAVVLKPSEVTPRCGALVASLFDGLVPKGLVAVVQGGGDVGRALVEAGVDVVSFTGSVATGRKVAVACAERFIPCALELGGKDAAIVLADCDVERAARGVVWGAFTNAGQNCASVERVYVERAVASTFIDRVVAHAKELRSGEDVSVLTTHAQAKIVRAHVEEAIERGAEVLVGGLPEDDDPLAFPPTVLQVEDDDLAVMRDETFGPVLPIAVVEDAEEAIRRTNASRYALTTSIWTKRVAHAHRLARQLVSGVVTINNHSFTAALPAAPWTGTKETGYGVTNSSFALHELTRPRFVLEDRNSAKRELWWYPYTPVLRTIAFAMATLRGGGGLVARIQALFTLLGALPKRLMGKDG